MFERDLENLRLEIKTRRELIAHLSVKLIGKGRQKKTDSLIESPDIRSIRSCSPSGHWSSKFFIFFLSSDIFPHLPESHNSLVWLMRTEENEEERENRRRKKRILIQILVSIACSDQGLRIVLCGEPKKDDMQIFKLPSEMLQNAPAKQLVVRLGSPNLRIRERNEIYLSAFHALTKCGKKITPRRTRGKRLWEGKI